MGCLRLFRVAVTKSPRLSISKEVYVAHDSGDLGI
jgi:hypothetical protein